MFAIATLIMVGLLIAGFVLSILLVLE